MDFDDFEGFIDGFGGSGGDGAFSYASEAAKGAFFVSSVFTTIISIAVAVLMIVALWKLFEKAGKPGWHSLIPFLNIYDLFQIGWKKKFGVATIVLMASGLCVMMIGMVALVMVYGTGWLYYSTGMSGSYDPARMFLNMEAGSIIWVLLVSVGAIALCVAAVFTAIAYIKVGQAFGKSGGFLVGLFFLPVIFLCILAFGKAQYCGHWEKDGFHPDPQPMPQNPFAQAPNPQMTQGQTPDMGVPTGTYNPGAGSVNDIPEAPRYCSGCGTVITPGSKFCSNCGKQFTK